jgi:RES domain-containing protein
MASVWRLTPPQFARALDGEGSRLAGGRWNSPGRRALYTSSHLSLCVLEVYVHMPLELRAELADFEAIRIEVPDSAAKSEISIKQFADLMTTRDPLVACQTIGDDWLARGSDLILQVPSVVVPEDPNLILNPAHPQMDEVFIASTRRFRFDPRLAAPLS